MEVDVRTPHAARVYDYALGGKDNYAADRELIDRVRVFVPEIPYIAQENRAFLGRAVHFLAAQAGIRQFLDIGSGLPTQSNVHEVAHSVASDARVVYVDYDLTVLAHGRALLSGTDNAIIIQADVRQPDEVLDHPKLRRLLDFEQPIALLLVGLLHLVTDDDDPAGIVARLWRSLPSGSYLAFCHLTGEYQPPETVARWMEVFTKMAEPMVLRSREQIRGFLDLDGCELIDPGLVQASQWRPDVPCTIPNPATGWLLAAVGRKT